MAIEESNSVNVRRQELDAAIGLLYQTFRKGLHGIVSGCPHCTSIDDDRRLRSNPLTQLTAPDLERFARKAVTTLGTVDDLKHFLPRMLEIAAFEGDIGDTELEIVLSKLDYSGWTTWPEIERSAIETYLRTLWRYALSQFPAAMEIDDCLCAIGKVAPDLNPYLNDWALDNSLAAARHFADFMESTIDALIKKRKIGNAFWSDRPDQMRQVVDWLRKPATLSHFEQAFFRYSTDPAAGELSQAAGSLEWVQSVMQ